MNINMQIKQISDREIWVGENKIYLGEDDILYPTLVGDMDDEMGIEFKEACFKLLSLVKGKANILVDLNNVGKPSPKARKTINELNRFEKVGKVAHIGLNPVSRMIIAFVLKGQKEKNMGFFKTKDEALIWLKE